MEPEPEPEPETEQCAPPAAKAGGKAGRGGKRGKGRGKRGAQDAPPEEPTGLRVIFLDCDGVLANSRSALMDYESDDDTLVHDPTGMNVPLEKRCLGELRRVAQATGAVIVLSTTWRVDAGMREFLVSALEPSLKVIGDTPSGVDTSNSQRQKLPKSEWRYGRGAEVAAWLAAHDGKVESFVILDDGHADSFAQSGLTDHFVETLLGDSPSISKEDGLKEGLTKAKADACIRILLGQGSSAS